MKPPACGRSQESREVFLVDRNRVAYPAQIGGNGTIACRGRDVIVLCFDNKGFPGVRLLGCAPGKRIAINRLNDIPQDRNMPGLIHFDYEGRRNPLPVIGAHFKLAIV